jgi:hypothetical protein
MTVQQLAELGKRMRKFQEAYFRVRNKSDLVQAKRLEHEFDSACNRVLDTRPKLFGDLKS